MTSDRTESPVRLDAVVRGRVQGVGYRFFVLETAADRGLVGRVSNEAGGTVRCVAEGRRSELEALLGDLWRGPFGARVDEVSATWGPASGSFDRFEVGSGAHAGD